MWANEKISETLSLLATVDPVSQAAGTVTTGWISAANHERFLAVVQSGVLGAAATLDAKLQQAAAGSSKQVEINLRTDELDTNGGFSWIRLSMTVGVAASQISALVLGAVAKQLPASLLNQAAVAQIV